MTTEPEEERNAVTVLKRTLACSVAGGVLGGATALFGNRPPLPTMLSVGANSTMVSFAFFGIRELAVQPTLKDFGWQREGADQFRPHTEGLTATALAGALTGGAFMGRLQGSARVLPGAITASLACSALHLALNELSLLRIFILARKEVKFQWSDLLPAANMDMGEWSPVRRIPDQEYRQRLQDKIHGYDTKMSQLDREIQELKNQQDIQRKAV